MLELHGVVRGARVEPASHVDWLEITEQFDDGDHVIMRLFRPRSHRENNLFHAIIQQAWSNQRGGPRFNEDIGGWKMLKAWLLCNAGHCNIATYPAGSITKQIVMGLRQNGFRGFFSPDPHTGQIQMRTPKRVAFKDLKHPDFQPVKNHVFETICNVIIPGATIEQMIMEATGGRYDGKRRYRKNASSGDKRKAKPGSDRLGVEREIPPATSGRDNCRSDDR